MPDVSDPPPADVKLEIGNISAALDQVVPAKMGQNLLVATWNIRAFDRVTPKWRSVSGDSPIQSS
jgi:hypothetical protein